MGRGSVSILPLVLTAWWPFINLLDYNGRFEIGVMRVSVDGLVFFAVCLGLLLVVKAVLPGLRTASVASVLAAEVVVFFTYLPLADLLRGLDVFHARYHFAVWLLIAILTGVVVARLARRNVAWLLLTVAGTVMCGLPLGRLLYFESQSSASQLGASRETAAIEAVRIRPNIYYFILDAYGRADQLQVNLGYDNTPFLNELRQRGFFVGDKSFANYPSTYLSVASTLQMRYVAMTGENVIRSHAAFTAFLRGRNATVERFKALGYRYVHAEPGGWSGTNCGGREDYCIRAGRKVVSNVELALLSLTPLRPVSEYMVLDLLTSSFMDLPRVMRSLRDYGASPFFLFAHIIAPHPPYRYRTDCSPRTEGEELKATWEESARSLYIETLSCVNRQVLDVVDEILRVDRTAFVVFQGDHGTAFRNQLDKPIEQWSEADVTERFAILNAYRFPGECRAMADNSYSAINTFPLVFACLEGRKPALVPDRFFLAAYEGKPSYGKVISVNRVLDRAGVLTR